MRLRVLVSAILILPLLLSPAPAQEKSAIVGSLKPFVDSRTLAGAVTLVATPDQILSLEAIGYADVDGKRILTPDMLFWIASMSKPITGAAIMALIDDGKLKADDPVEKYLPEFKGQMIAEPGKDRLVLKKPARPITVKDLLSHTSGLVLRSLLEPNALDALPLKDAVHSYAMSHLQFEPGSKYQYCNPGINTAGRIVEVVSGMPFEEFLQKRFFTPLGMKDTTFFPSDEQMKRLATSYKGAADKKGLQATTITALTYPLSDTKKRYAFPGGGLFSTATDLSKFCQMVLNRGTFGGKRILSEESVKQMTSPQTGMLKVGGEGGGYGLGWATAKGAYGHGGAYNTWMWIEPTQQRILILMMQHAGFPGPDGAKIRPTFQKTALESFMK